MSLAKFKQNRNETRAFKKIVAKRSLQARRKAFADESLVQAGKKGKELAVAKANRGGFGSNLRKASGTIIKRVLSPPKKAPTRIRTVKRKAPVRRVIVERTPATPAGFEGFL